MISYARDCLIHKAGQLSRGFYEYPDNWRPLTPNGDSFMAYYPYRPDVSQVKIT